MSEFCCIDNENPFDPTRMVFKVKENTDKSNRTVLVNCRYNYEEEGILGPVNLELTAQVIWKYDSTDKTTRDGTKLLKHDIVFKIDPTTVDTLQSIRSACVEYIKENKLDLVINTTENKQAIKDSFTIRRSSVDLNVPYYTNMRATKILTKSLISLKNQSISVKAIQNHHNQVK